MKKCSKCEVTKELADLYIRKNGKPHSSCKECFKAVVMARYKAHPKQILWNTKQYAAAARKRIREATFAAYGGSVCACCGETELKFLTLDHINNDGAAFRRRIAGKRAAAGYTTYRWLAKNGFPVGYQVLCMNCNYGKRMNNGVCPHKTRCNDYPEMGVGPSGPKRIAPVLKVVGQVEDIVSPTVKAVAA